MRPASEFLVALTITITRMVALLVSQRVAVGGDRLSLQPGDERHRAGSTRGARFLCRWMVIPGDRRSLKRSRVAIGERVPQDWALARSGQRAAGSRAG